MRHTRVSAVLVITALGLSLLAMVPAPSGAARGAFTHGIAARAEARSAMLWTRTAEAGGYRFQVARDRAFDRIVASGRTRARAGSDFTMKPVVDGLRPGTTYFYRFVASDGSRSPVGTFHTLPAPGRRSELFLAYSGDSDVLWTDHPDPDARPFEVLTRIKEEHPDLFLYFGDTIYSDSETGAEPALTKAAKWRKYKRNRIAPTRAVLASVSTWAGWDDHEVINDFDGAELQVTDPALFQAGRAAFNDYWPVRESRYYRKVDYGSEIDLFFLDERSYRTQSPDEADSPCRDAEGTLDLVPTMPTNLRAELGLGPVDPECLAHVEDPTRTMLGAEQLQWFKDALVDSTATWKLVVNQVPITQIYALPYDRWEGYAAERADLLTFIADNNIQNVVFLTTDLHTNVGARVYVDIDSDASAPVAYEAIAGPIQTCTLRCETDRLLGEGTASQLRGFLRAKGLVDDDCIQLDQYGYATVRVPEAADRLVLGWRSNERRRGGGGRPVADCPSRVVLAS